MDNDTPNDTGNSASAASVNPHLGGKDIRFLKAIQAVNERAGYKPGTDERPPATTGKIASAADLNKNEVNYRFNQRGFDATGLGYIRVYGSEMLPNGHCQRSVQNFPRRAKKRCLTFSMENLRLSPN